MTTQQDPDTAATEQTGGAHPDRDRGGTRRDGWHGRQDGGFDDMNIPGWADYAAARAVALEHLSRLSPDPVESQRTATLPVEGGNMDASPNDEGAEEEFVHGRPIVSKGPSWP